MATIRRVLLVAAGGLVMMGFEKIEAPPWLYFFSAAAILFFVLALGDPIKWRLIGATFLIWFTGTVLGLWPTAHQVTPPSHVTSPTNSTPPTITPLRTDDMVSANTSPPSISPADLTGALETALARNSERERARVEAARQQDAKVEPKQNPKSVSITWQASYFDYDNPTRAAHPLRIISNRPDALLDPRLRLLHARRWEPNSKQFIDTPDRYVFIGADLSLPPERKLFFKSAVEADLPRLVTDMLHEHSTRLGVPPLPDKASTGLLWRLAFSFAAGNAEQEFHEICIRYYYYKNITAEGCPPPP